MSSSRRQRVARPQRALHQHAVEPAAELEADILNGADHPKAAGGMEAYGGGLRRIADHRHHLAFAERRALLDQHRQQRPADALPDRILVDIDRVLDGELVGRTRPPVAGIGVAQHSAIALGHEVGQAEFEHGGAALLHFGDIGRIDLEGGRAVQHVMPVNLRAARDIGLGRGSYDEALQGQSAHPRTITNQLRLPRPKIWPASGPSYLNSESASCWPTRRSVKVTSTLLPRLSMIDQPRSCIGFSDTRTITFPSCGLRDCTTVSASKPSDWRCRDSTARSPESCSGSLTR